MAVAAEGTIAPFPHHSGLPTVALIGALRARDVSRNARRVPQCPAVLEMPSADRPDDRQMGQEQVDRIHTPATLARGSKRATDRHMLRTARRTAQCGARGFSRETPGYGNGCAARRQACPFGGAWSRPQYRRAPHQVRPNSNNPKLTTDPCLQACATACFTTLSKGHPNSAGRCAREAAGLLLRRWVQHPPFPVVLSF